VWIRRSLRLPPYRVSLLPPPSARRGEKGRAVIDILTSRPDDLGIEGESSIEPPADRLILQLPFRRLARTIRGNREIDPGSGLPHPSMRAAGPIKGVGEATSPRYPAFSGNACRWREPGLNGNCRTKPDYPMTAARDCDVSGGGWLDGRRRRIKCASAPAFGWIRAPRC